MEINVLILAAGRGERMRAAFPYPKALVPIDHIPMIIRLLSTLLESVLIINRIVIIVRLEEKEMFDRELHRYLPSIYMQKILLDCQVQEEDGYGTASGVQAFLKRSTDPLAHPLLVLNGDAPLIESVTLEKMTNSFFVKNVDLVIGTVFMEDPRGYGRIAREDEGGVCIVEQKQINVLPAEHEWHNLREVNTGMYMIHPKLLPVILTIEDCPITGEKKLTDICMETASIYLYSSISPDEVLNINSPLDRNHAEYVLFKKRQDNIHRPLFALLQRDIRNHNHNYTNRPL